jgi:uncharacterized protein YcfL
MKPNIALTLSLITVALLLAGCASTQDGKKTEDSSGVDEPMPMPQTINSEHGGQHIYP